MARTIDKCPELPLNVDPWVGHIKQELTVQVVTPMFGGGVEAGEPDPVTLIRASSIRGHLRFWWRATRGATCNTIEKLKQRETEIWGDTDSPSKVVIRVAIQPETYTKRKHEEDYGFQRYGPEAYALFSAKQNGKPLIKEGVSFSLALQWPMHKQLQIMRDKENANRKGNNKKLLDPIINDITPDVTSALCYWLQYGGLGARTRRGCGALQLIVSKPQLMVCKLMESSIRVFLGKETGNALQAWNESVHIYQDFRQSFRGARHNKTSPNGTMRRNIPGRSHWPEPDSIRRLTDCALNRPGGPSSTSDDVDTHNHTKPIVPSDTIPAFPRAMLGLPIIFHFADSPSKGRPADRNLDPQDVELVPEFPEIHDKDRTPIVGTRMASPVITRPIFYNERWRPAIILLPRLSSLNARLRGKLAKYHQGQSTYLDVAIPNDQIENHKLSVLRPMNGKDNAIDALISFVLGKEFQEVQL
ncbi:MAG: type III-B CRISPR module RAMP protein Cmr1 [Syntrophaceae bacterium]|nr:type III-B CRISPR module RAMP protein Cmr1 [Syntrophaceae bacterium]